MRHRSTRKEMARRRRLKVAWVRNHIDLFIKADVYAEENEIRYGYDWQGHLKECPAAVTILTEIRKVIFYMGMVNHKGGPELRLDIWHSLYWVSWKKRVRPTVQDYDYLVRREKQKSIAAVSDPMSNLFP